VPKKVVWKTETGDTTTQPPGQTGPNRFANKHVYIVPGTSTYEQMAQKGREILAARMKNNKTQEERKLYGMGTTSVNTLVVTNEGDLLEMEGHIIRLCAATPGNPKHIEVPVQGVVVTTRQGADDVCLPDGTWVLPRPLTLQDHNRVNIVRERKIKVEVREQGNYLHVVHLEG
jgi:hypothetical protein